MTKADVIVKFRAVMKECLDHGIVAIVVVSEEGMVDEVNVLHTLETNAMAATFLGGIERNLGRSDA